MPPIFRRLCAIHKELGSLHRTFSVGLDDGRRSISSGDTVRSRSEILQQTFLLFGRDVRVT